MGSLISHHATTSKRGRSERFIQKSFEVCLRQLCSKALQMPSFGGGFVIPITVPYSSCKIEYLFQCMKIGLFQICKEEIGKEKQLNDALHEVSDTRNIRPMKWMISISQNHLASELASTLKKIPNSRSQYSLYQQNMRFLFSKNTINKY